MKARLQHLWHELISGYWFRPGMMCVAAVCIATALIRFDRWLLSSRVDLGWFYGGGSDGAKTLLSTVAGSVITVAGVVFSITIAALTQASSQFGPRMLRNFMRDIGNQIVLGTFLATFLYCLLILRTIHGEIGDGKEFVPQASVTVAVLLAAASIAVLIYFIHHVSISLQAPMVVAAVKRDLHQAIARQPEVQTGSAVMRDPGGETALESSVNDGSDKCVVRASSEGYVQVIDYEGLLQLACKLDVLLRLKCRPGDYLIKGAVLLSISPKVELNPAIERELNAAFLCGDHATPEQDVEYAIRQLVEVAVRALSPGVNDPFTAINCIDALAGSLCLISRRGLPGPLRFDATGKARIVSPVTTFDGVCDATFNQIRQNGSTSVAVMIRLLEVITECADHVTDSQRRKPLLKHARIIYEQARQSITEPHDRADVEQRWAGVIQAFGATPGPTRDG